MSGMSASVLTRIITVFILSVLSLADLSIIDVKSQPECVGAKLGDHVLFHFSMTYQNGSTGPNIKQNQQPYYMQLPEVADEDGIYTSLVGMCDNSTRRLTYSTMLDAQAHPLIQGRSELYTLDETFIIDLHMHKVTIPEDYQIFTALRAANISLVLDLVEQHRGINSMDEYGQTPLMIAVSKQYQPVVAALLNTRRPKVDINLVKANGFSALFYAVEKANPGILQALLRRGADPNLAIVQDGSRGNTPLHYACMLEKVKHAEILLEYGANPFLSNEYGQTPFKMIPPDTVPSIRRQYQSIFEEAHKKIELANSGAVEQKQEL